MDMVFSDTGDLQGGFYDSNGGLDYHVPVSGGVGAAVRLNVVHVTVEMAPVAKVSSLYNGEAQSSLRLRGSEQTCCRRCTSQWRWLSSPERHECPSFVEGLGF